MPIWLWLGMGSRASGFHVNCQREKAPHQHSRSTNGVTLQVAYTTAIDRCCVFVRCDNSVTVNAIHKGSSSSPIMRDIVRSICSICMQHHILLSRWPVHIAGKHNVTAVGLSREIVSARSDRWSLNEAITNQWHATAGAQFDVDAFADTSG